MGSHGCSQKIIGPQNDLKWCLVVISLKQNIISESRHITQLWHIRRIRGRPVLIRIVNLAIIH